MFPLSWGTWSFLCSLLESSLRSSVVLTFVPFRTVIFLPFSKREGGSPCLPYIFLIILIWFVCSIETCIQLLLVASFEWPCLVCHSRSPHCQSGVYSTCLDLIRVFLLFFKRFNLPLLEIFFYSHFIIWCSLRASFLYSSIWLLQASLDSCYFLNIFFLPFFPLYRNSSINCLFIHAFLFGEHFDIGQLIIDTITPYRDFSFCHGALIFRLLISRLLEHIGFEITTTQRVQVAHALLDESS